MSKLSNVKQVIINVLSDYNEHTTDEIRKIIIQEGIIIEPNSSIVRSAIYQLRSSGMNIESRERGIYQLKKNNNQFVQLDGFVVIKPEERFSKRNLYIHEDGKIVLNGKLNNEIKSRKIEIRISSDAEKIALVIEGDVSHKFTKSGHATNKAILKMINKRRICFPLCYEMNEEQKDKLWVGELRKAEKSKKGNIK